MPTDARNGYLAKLEGIKTIYVMKKAILILLSFVLLYPCPASAEGQSPIEIPIHSGDAPGDRPRSQGDSPITCYVYGYNNFMSLSSISLACNAIVAITNSTSCENTIEPIVLSATPVMLSLLGPGEYNIVITLSSGDVYYGEFRI